MICEYCNKEHIGSYASGRFCSEKCARGFSSRDKRKEINEKVSKSLSQPDKWKFCIECGIRVAHNNKSGYCKQCKPKFTNTELTRRYRRRRKEKYIEYKGGKCVVCGYNKSYRALVFHHNNGLEKDFNLSKAEHFSFEKAKQELDKCILLCANCHAELHEELDKIKVLNGALI